VRLRSSPSRLRARAPVTIDELSDFPNDVEPLLSRRTRYFPIFLAMLWLCGSVALFAFGPYEYPIHNGPLLYSYLCAAHLALLLGYATSARRGAAYQGRWRPSSMLHLGLFVTLVIVLLTFLLGQASSTGFRTALEDPGLAYNRYVTQGGSLVSYLLILLEPFSAPFLVLVAFYWRTTNHALRLTFLVILAFNVLNAVGVAVRGAIVFQILVVGAAFAASYFSGRLRFKALGRIQVAGLILVGLVLLMSYFSFVFTQRDVTNSASFNAAIGAFPDADHSLVTSTPPELQPLLMGGITYLTHGYYGLSLALEKQWVSSGFGLANSTFLLRNFERITGSSALYDASYAGRMWTENGYPVGNLWMTIYPWIASDVTFVGALVVVFMIGTLFARSWMDAVQRGNPRVLSHLHSLHMSSIHFL
jgi:hypothetical protein